MVNFETANVIYTSINVTSATGNGGTEETRPVEEKITISKKPAIKKLKAAKGRITVSWNKFGSIIFSM